MPLLNSRDYNLMSLARKAKPLLYFATARPIFGDIFVMNSPSNNTPDINSSNVTAQIEAQYARMKQVQLREGIPNAAVRKDRLQRCINLLVDHKDELSKALEQDFGGRSPNLTQLSEIMQGTGHYKHALKHVEKYMKAEKRSAPFPICLLYTSPSPRDS